MRFIPILLLCLLASSAPAQTVPRVDLSEIALSEFADDELDLPYYLEHFHTIANSVVMSGPLRGFLDIPVWRQPDQLAPHNARIMENILSIAFFYATDRPWNPYHGHPAVRARLEAALNFWVGMQSEDGLFSEAGEDAWGISPTAFATLYMGETLRLLSGGPPIADEVLAEVVAADRKAILAILTNEQFFDHGTRYSNHYTAAWAGALAFVSLFPNPDLSDRLEQRLRQGLVRFQSPAGFFYERRGPDWVFEIETHHSNNLTAWHYLRGSPLGNAYTDAIRRWYEWFAYNAAIEPDGSGFTVNHAIETRLTLAFYEENRTTTYGGTCLPVAEQVVLVRAFCESREEAAARVARRRDELERSWPSVPPLRLGDFYGYSPITFLHRNRNRWHPTNEQKAAARDLLPYLASNAFTHHRADDRVEFGVTFIRRPAYYAAFNAGERLDEDQAYGLGVVWIPDYGAVLQSHKAAGTSWGTRPQAADIVYEAEIRDRRIERDGEAVTLDAGAENVGPGTVTISYPLGSRGEKSVTFLPDEIVVTIRHDGPFEEVIPLLVAPNDRMEVGNTVARIGQALSLDFDENASASIRSTRRRIGRKQLEVLYLQANGDLEYRLRF
jgi:hypothetical protein